MTSAGLASRRRRLAATLIDLLLLAVAGFLLALITGAFEGPEAYASRAAFLARSLGVLCGAWLLLHGWYLFTTSQTLGKHWLGLVIVDPSGEPAGLLRLLARAGLPVLVCPLPYGLFLWLLSLLPGLAPPRRCLHDYVVGTQVIGQARP